MQAKSLDISLRDPQNEIHRRGSDAMISGMQDPDLPKIMTKDDIRRLRIRKRLEYALIRSMDKGAKDIKVREECWYLMDAEWLNKWASFTRVPRKKKRRSRRRRGDGEGDMDISGRSMDSMDSSSHSTSSTVSTASTRSVYSVDDIDCSNHSDAGNLLLMDSDGEEEDEEDHELPGPVSSKNLVDENGKPLIDDLKAARDYRGVPATSYYIFIELYGKDTSPDIPRYQVDIYKPEVPVGRLVNIQFRAKQEARLQVAKIRPKWQKWERPELDEDDEEDKKCCCGLTRDHFDAFIYWMVRCCFVSRKKDGRNSIKYSDYSPMRYKEGDSTHGLDSSHGSRGGGSRHSRGRNKDSGSSDMDRSSGALNPLHVESGAGDNPNARRHIDLSDGTSLADLNYESGGWVQKTRIGSWFS